MRVKSYFVADPAAALAIARQELGTDAVLLQTRKAPPEAAHLGSYEVVFGLPGPNGAARPPAGESEEGGLQRLRLEVAHLRRQLERMSAAVARTSWLGAGAAAGGEEGARLLARLVEAEMAPEQALELIEGAHRRQAAQQALSLEAALAAELESRWPVQPRLGCEGEGPRIVALVGPSGAGKTTTLVKLAIREGLEGRKPVQLLSLDNYRVGGAEQLRSYATILGVPFQALETARALEGALRECRRKDLVLIDTPGYGAAEAEEAQELAEWLGGREDVDRHLVLTASMRSADLWRVAERFERLRPHKLLFTRLDETESYGPLWDLAIRLGKPISFLCAGQRIPEDLEPATASKLVELLWRGQPARAAAATV